MIRKLIFRTFLVGATFTGLFVVGIVVGGYLAFRQPSFYADLRTTAAQDITIDEELEAKTAAFEEWVMLAAASAKHAEYSESPTNDSLRNAPEVSPTHVFEVTETQLNAQLVADHFNAGDMRNPRVKLLDDRLRIGAEVHLNDLCFVFSADLKPAITAGSKLQLEIENAYLGSLQLPVHSLLNAMSRHVKNSDPKFQLDVSGSAPVITMDLSNTRSTAVSVKSVHCERGALAIEFESATVNDSGAPVGERLSNRMNTTTPR